MLESARAQALIVASGASLLWAAYSDVAEVLGHPGAARTVANESWDYPAPFARVSGDPFKDEDLERHERQYARRFSDETRVADLIGNPTINNRRTNPQQLRLSVADMRALLGEVPASARLRTRITARLDHVLTVHASITDQRDASLLREQIERTRALLDRLNLAADADGSDFMAPNFPVPQWSVAPTRTVALTVGLAGLAADDSLLGTDTPITYGDARAKFSVPGTDQGLGKVLDKVWHLVSAAQGPDVATGIAAYVVNKGTGQPSTGWNRHFEGLTSPTAAREVFRERAHELLLEHGREGMIDALLGTERRTEASDGIAATARPTSP